jgi:hypothetical protein
MTKQITDDYRLQNKKEAFAKKLVTNQQKPSNADKDLMSSMAQRLAKVEKTCDLQRKEIAEKCVEIAKLKKENETLSAIKSDGMYQELLKTKELYQTTVNENNEIKQFLKDYGLVWRGKGDVSGTLDQSAINQLISESHLPYKTNLPTEIDLNVVARRIEELNFVVERDIKITKGNSNVHQFEVKLLFRNCLHCL